jgi:hypothetical protein
LSAYASIASADVGKRSRYWSVNFIVFIMKLESKIGAGGGSMRAAVGAQQDQTERGLQRGSSNTRREAKKGLLSLFDPTGLPMAGIGQEE